MMALVVFIKASPKTFLDVMMVNCGKARLGLDRTAHT